jgi:hypothetical protein
MAVANLSWAWDWVFGGDNGYTATNQYNFPPTNMLAQTSLSVASPGLGITGFSQYSTRPQPNGADRVINLPAVFVDGGIICYPPLAYDPSMTSLTWLLICGGGLDQMTASLLFFSFD